MAIRFSAAGGDTLEQRPTLSLKDAALLKQQCYIDGCWIDADSKATRDVNNPATSKRLGTVPLLAVVKDTRLSVGVGAKPVPVIVRVPPLATGAGDAAVTWGVSRSGFVRPKPESIWAVLPVFVPLPLRGPLT